MRFDFAPMEGLTDGIYRALHHRFFPGIDRYYTPFFSPTIHRSLTAKEARELKSAETLDYFLVPQVLTKIPEDFLWMAQQCKERGFTQINLNLGCPSGTVTAKKKGSGMLQDPDALDRFLHKIFSGTDLKISIKTRIGFQDPKEFPRLLEIFNRYPVEELIIHPRVRDDFYSKPVRMDAFEYAMANSSLVLCYNGNLNTKRQAEAIARTYPKINAVMIGRGLIGDPGMLTPGGTQISVLEDFMEALLESYIAAFGSARNAMFRLKENWRYLICHFGHNEKLNKQLRKTTEVSEYRRITQEIFHNLPFLPELNPDWQ